MSTKGITHLPWGWGLLAYGNFKPRRPLKLLNVSCDPTREVYTEIDAKFAAQFKNRRVWSGRHVDQRRLLNRRSRKSMKP